MDIILIQLRESLQVKPCIIKTNRYKINTFVPYETPKRVSIPLSNKMGSGGTKPDNSWKIEASKRFTVAPAYNKGPYQVIAKEDIKTAGRKI